MKNETIASTLGNTLQLILARLRGRMQVFALVGPSGTGKSFRARILASRYKIRFIIDDGILIRDKKIIAGRSAKREKAYLTAVKTAIFDDLAHRYDVRSTLDRHHCRRLLILGTSDRMIYKICQALQLPEPTRIIMIHEIATSEEIQKATENRKLFGRHVIPVPAKEVRKTSPRIVTDEIKLWSTEGILRTDKVYEKTLVRPVFSTGEALQVADSVMKQALRNALEAYTPGARLTWFKARFDEGYELELTITPPQGTDLNSSTQIHRLRRLNPARIDDLSRLLSDHLEKQTGVKIRQCTIILREHKQKKK
jgi:adenylate kinase family enzyme